MTALKKRKPETLYSMKEAKEAFANVCFKDSWNLDVVYMKTFIHELRRIARRRRKVK